MSNHISPGPPGAGLSFRKTGPDRIEVLSADAQPREMRAIIQRANDKESVRLFAALTKAAERLDAECGRDRTNRSQFYEPLREILEDAHAFLTGCEDLSRIDTREKQKRFERFLFDQVHYRMVLLRRISGARAEDYRKANAEYAAQMEEQERKEWADRKKTR